MFAAFLAGYITCALWSSTDDDGTPLDAIDAELSAECLAVMRTDCADFVSANRIDLDLAHEQYGLAWDYLGHDFWLTRNHHGAGFWDRGMKTVGERLTKASHPYGSCDLYVGDDGFIHC